MRSYSEVSINTKEKIINYFQENNAMDKNSAIDIKGLYSDDGSTESTTIKLMLKYFCQVDYVKKHGSKYWLDEESYKHPFKNYLRRCLRIAVVLVPAFIILTIVMILLSSNS